MHLFLVFFSDAIRVVFVELHVLVVPSVDLYVSGRLERMCGKLGNYLSPRTRTDQEEDRLGGVAVFLRRWLFVLLTFSLAGITLTVPTI